jgi:hypothetical protein
MIIAKSSKTLLSAASISLVLLAVAAGSSFAKDQSQTAQTSNCPCCQNCQKTAS